MPVAAFPSHPPVRRRHAVLLLLICLAGCRDQSLQNEPQKTGRTPASDVKDSTPADTGADPAADSTRALVQQSLGESAPAFATAENWKMLQEAYRERENRALWSEGAAISERARRLVQAVCQADQQGLHRNRFDLEGLSRAIRSAYQAAGPDPSALADLELRLASTFLHYGSALRSGELDLATRDSGWYVRSRLAQTDSALRAAFQAERFEEMERALQPAAEGSRELAGELGRYRRIAATGGWPKVPDERLAPGSRGPGVPELRKRLAATGDLAEDAGGGETYDGEMAAAVSRFQERHGLAPDSVAGPGTLAALNVPVEMRIRQIELNLDRHRWLPEDRGERYILVNIPEFEARVYENGTEALEMRIIVGREYEDATPVLVDSLSQVVFQPYWNVPASIVREELAPKASRDPSYLADHGFEVRREARGDVVDPGDQPLDRFLVRQRPGGENPLGQVKFALPNRFDIYLHDTPQRELFQRRDRALSHGCIRVERAADLAAYTLQWDTSRVREAMVPDGREEWERRVEPARKVPVYILYLTAFWRDGKLHFRDDIYGMDQQALLARPQESGRVTERRCEELGELLQPPA
jgi:murein L,D-transpeptidase YcbB/YkuD